MSDAPGDTEQRRFTRIPFDASVELSLVGGPVQDAAAWHAQLLDICLKGALFTRPADWHGRVGNRYHLEIQLGDAPIVMAMDGHVVHVQNASVGFSWDQLDVESAGHLHRLIELNLGDSALLERELQELLKLTPR